MRKKTTVLAGVILLLLVSAGLAIFINQRSENTALERIRSLPVPANWQLTSTEDTLVRGTCLGSGSKCGNITKKFITNTPKQNALVEGTATLKREGWTFSNTQIVGEELQVTARQQDKLLYLITSDNKARIKYEENHN